MRTKPKWKYTSFYPLGITGDDTPEIDAIIHEWEQRQKKGLSKTDYPYISFKKTILEYGKLPEEAYTGIKKAIAGYGHARTHHEKAPNKAEINEAIKTLSKDVSALLGHLVELDDMTREVILNAAIDDMGIEHGEGLFNTLKWAKENLVNLSAYLSVAEAYCRKDLSRYHKSSRQDRLFLAHEIIDILSHYGVPCTQQEDGPLCSILGMVFYLLDGRNVPMGRDIQAIAKEALK